MKISKQKYFFIIVFMLMLTTYLPLVYTNLPPIIRSHHLWTAIWGGSIFVLYPNVLFCRLMRYVILYGIFLFTAIELFWIGIDDWNKGFLIKEYYEIAMGASIISYFQITKDYPSLARIVKWTIVFVGITALLSILSATINPMYARNITGLGTIEMESEREAAMAFRRYGGGTYATAIVFMSILPVLVYYYKFNEKSIVNKRFLIVTLLILFIALFSMQFFGNILLAIVFGTLAMLGVKNFKKSLLIITLFTGFVVAIPSQAYVNTFSKIGSLFENQQENVVKFNDLAEFIKAGGNVENPTTITGRRIQRYSDLFNTFTISPMLGYYFLPETQRMTYKQGGGHLYWMNKLAITGIMGFLIFFSIILVHLKSIRKQMDLTSAFFYLLALFSFLSYGLIKVLTGREAWYTFFVIIPGLYYLQFFKGNKSDYSPD